VTPSKKPGPGDPAAHRRASLPLLPSGSGGVRRFLLHRARPLIIINSAPGRAICLWRRGWAFEVALRSLRDALPLGGPTPSGLRFGHPMKGEYPFQNPRSNPPSKFLFWRRGWDLNPRSPYEDNGFRDRPNRPLSHLSLIIFTFHTNKLDSYPNQSLLKVLRRRASIGQV
jgi:hypothetical protein